MMNIKQIVIRFMMIGWCCLLFNRVEAQQYKPDDKLSSIVFSVKHFGITTKGTFSGLKGDIQFDRAFPEASKFKISIDTKSVNTGVELRDEHLRGNDYLDVTHYPFIQFVSTKVTTNLERDSFLLHGQLTLKGHQKEVLIPFTVTAIDNGYLFSGTFSISRSEFEIGGGVVISNNVDITLNTIATK